MSKRATEAQRAQRRARVKKLYEGTSRTKGKTVRQIAAETGFSYGHVHALLGEAGVSMRKRGGSYR